MDQNPLLNTCGGFFTDSGGNSNNYSNSENLFTTICADRAEGTHVKLTFIQIDLSFGDELCFFDGLDNTAPILACASDYYNGFPFIIQSTAANLSGCLTISFNSNGNTTNKGWEANIDCVPSCQLIQAGLTSTNPAPIIADTGWIDICQGERVNFEGEGFFPQDGLVYDHSENTSTFEWDFGDGIVAVGKNVSHVYQKPGGYKASLTITDQFGCTNSNFVIQRIRVATKPNFSIVGIPEEICLGDTVQLSGSLSSDNFSSNIEASTQEGAFLFNGIRSDSLALPDGNGTSYQTSIRFTDFNPGQVLNDINDLQSICVNMEHSWLHDMEISITCPSGNSVLLQRQEVINEEVYLGIPNDNDGIEPKAGVGLNYCWVPVSKNGTITEYANANDESSPSDPYYLPDGDYNSFEDLENLLGCPLNGEWTITVTDLWEQDNGWIFSWGIDINPDLYPSLETFEPQIIDYQWENNTDIISYSQDIILARPQNAGAANFIFSATDDFGCSHDTTVQVTVLPPNHPDCINCEEVLFQQDEITICEGDIVRLENFIDPIALGVLTFEAFPNYEFSFTNHPTVNPYESSLQVSNIADAEIAADGSNLISVCLNLESEFNADLSLILVSPNGVNLNLSIENGGSSDGYLNTCFTANADTLITEGTGPFAGDYRPEEPFTNLAGTDINGVWKLRVSDDAGLAATDINVLKSWSMTFSSPSDARWEWTPTTNLSCTNCTDPIAQPDETTEYILQKDLNGCQVFDTITVNVFQSSAPQPLIDYSLPNGEVLVNWITVPNADAYEVSFDGLAWTPPNGDYFHVISGLENGESFNFFVRALFTEFNCATTPRSKAIRYVVCDLENELINPVLTTSCAGNSDGEIVISTTGGIAPYTYTLNETFSGSVNRFTGLTAGKYNVLIQDSTMACADTLTFTVEAPPPLQLSYDITALNCFGDTNGRILAIPTGGVGDYQVIDWSDNAGSTFEIFNLVSGNYTVTVADGNNCEIIDTVELIEPSQLSAFPSASIPTCFGGTDGAASMKVSGATPPYSLMWNNNQTGPSAVNLGSGDYMVTISDANSCRLVSNVTINDPREIVIDLIVEPITCADTANGKIRAEVLGGIPPYKYRWSNDQTNKIAFNLSADTYFLTVSDSRGCEKIVQQVIDVPNPLIVSTTAISSLCFGDSNGSAEATVVGGTAPYTYAWNDPNNQTSKILTNIPPGDYEVTVKDAMGCEATSFVQVTEAASINFVTASTAATCYDRADGMANIRAEGGTGTYSFLWDTGDTTATISGLSPNWYFVTLQDSNGCQFLDSVKVDSPDTLVIDSINQEMPLCFGLANGELSASISGGVEPYIYNWDNRVNANPFIGVAAGLHTLNVTDANGCEVTRSDIFVAEPDSLIIVTQINDSPCYGENTGTALANILGGTGPYSYQWNDANAQTDSLAINLGAGNYRVTVTDNNNCTVQQEVRIRQPDTTILGGMEQFAVGCFNSQQGAAFVVPGGGSGNPENFNINWSNGAVGATAFNLSAGMISVTITDANNCELIDSINILERDSIEVDIATVEPSCFGDEDGRMAITGISGGNGMGQIENYTISWSTTNEENLEFITGLAGDFTYSLTITDEQGCRNIIERNLGQPARTSIELVKEDISCFGAADGKISVQNQEGQALIAVYNWKDNVADTLSSEAINLNFGDYSVTVTDEDGCMTSAITNIEQPEAIFISEVNITPNVCNDDLSGKIMLEVIGGQPNYTFLWSNGMTTQNLENVSSGNYELSITDANNCELVESYELINPDALAGNILSQAVSCFGDRDGSLSIIATGGEAPYSYSLNGNTYNGQNKVVGLESDIYTVFIKDNNGCIWESSSLQITQPPPFSVTANSLAETVNFGDSTQISATFQNNAGNVQYSWEANLPGTFICDQTLCSTIMVKPTSSTTYEIYAIDDNGCEATTQITINVSKTRKIFVPTGFSPNEDGTNDVLMVHGQESAKIRSFKLFDRWGEEVYTAFDLLINDPLSGWDGTFRGQKLNSGVFAWLIEVEYADGEVEVLKGSTTLIR